MSVYVFVRSVSNLNTKETTSAKAILVQRVLNQLV